MMEVRLEQETTDLTINKLVFGDVFKFIGPTDNVLYQRLSSREGGRGYTPLPPSPDAFSMRRVDGDTPVILVCKSADLVLSRKE